MWIHNYFYHQQDGHTDVVGIMKMVSKSLSHGRSLQKPILMMRVRVEDFVRLYTITFACGSIHWIRPLNITPLTRRRCCKEGRNLTLVFSSSRWVEDGSRSWVTHNKLH